MARMIRGRAAWNPWEEPELPEEQGRAIIHVSPDAGDLRFSRDFLTSQVASQTDGSVVWQVGVFGRTPERSAQIVLVNGASWTNRWPSFVAKVRRLAVRLCEALAQQYVILETQDARGAYKAVTYYNPEWAAQRRLFLAGRPHAARGLPGRRR